MSEDLAAPAALRSAQAEVVPSPWRLRTAANGVTALRIAATPVLVIVVLARVPSWGALALWAALALSDGADGWLARRRGTSASGAFLDPLADKFLVLGALSALADLGRFSWVPVALLAARELLITSFRVLVARHGTSVPARRSAKAKTVIEFAAVAWALLPGAPGQSPVSRDVLWFAVALAWASAVQYLADWRAAGRRPAVGA